MFHFLFDLLQWLLQTIIDELVLSSGWLSLLLISSRLILIGTATLRQETVERFFFDDRKTVLPAPSDHHLANLLSRQRHGNFACVKCFCKLAKPWTEWA